MKSSLNTFIAKIVILLGITTTVVISSQQNKTSAPSGLDGQPYHGSQENEELTSEEEDLDKEIADEHTQTCVELLVDCWLHFNKTKPYLKEHHRERICFKRVHGFPVCGALDDEDIKNAKQQAETHMQEVHEKKSANAERRRRLQDLREEWEEIRDSIVNRMVSTPSDIEETTEFNSREADD